MNGTWYPRYTITPQIATWLMEIEAARAVIEQTTFTPAVLAQLRAQARIRATHYSTRIEGNRLTLEQASQVIEAKSVVIQGRERDVREVRNYWDALVRIEDWASQGKPLTEEMIRKVHALVEYGPRAKPTSYRDGQNVIRDSVGGGIVYLPPEAKDVPGLMTGLVAWINQSRKETLPTPLLAALAHYQFVTIHPFYDGNGRTARLLATYLLHRGGYGLQGIFSLEEYHARDLEQYYKALVTHPHHNYYEGRAGADLTGWLTYFTGLLADVFRNAKVELSEARESAPKLEPDLIKQLDHRARVVLGLFANSNTITAAQVAKTLGLSDRMARNLLQGWVGQGWLVVADSSRRSRTYALSAIYRQFIGNSSAMTAG